MTAKELLEAYAKGEQIFVGAYLTGADLPGADLTGADLTDADLTRANLIGADLTGAYLIGAYLTRANLIGADLTDADLTRANLARADLGAQWIVQGPARSDGYWFSLQKLTGESEPMLRAGCRYFTLAKAREHWNKTRTGTPLGNETFAILDCLEALAKARSLL